MSSTDAFETAVLAYMDNHLRKTSFGEVARAAEAYEVASGLSRAEAGQHIIIEATRRLAGRPQ